ncbi:MAG: hypothetical protein GQ534_12285, partial [Candidatus Delongbacteria bacterium]|nr:hypothetical protein [Candidatus Delongbacteria bacterium]
MKKMLVVILLGLTFASYSQSEELLKMYEKITGKDFSAEIEKMKKKDTGIIKSEEVSLIDSIGIEPDILEIDSVVVEDTYFEKYVNGVLIDPYDSKLKQFSIDFSSVKTTMNFNKRIPDSYILSQGDEFVIDIWGAMDK